MDKLASELYASALYTLRRGCALWIPEPNRELTSEYCRIGVQIGDVGILRTDGSFDFIFNICYPADHDINRLNYGVPDDFEQIEWNGKKRATENYFRPGEPILSRGAKKQALGIGGTASVPGIPVGGGAGLSIKFSKDRGAVIIPPNGADSVDCQSLDDFFDYAQRHAVSWYRFVNETLRMQVENGALYLVTGFDKTDCWENAVFSHNLKERVFEIIVNTGGLAGGDGRLHLSDSSLHEAFSSRCSPANNVNHNQALFVRGYRISMHHKLKTLFGRSPVEITSTYDSLWKDVLGKKSPQFSFRRGQSSSSGSKPSSSGSGSSRGTSSSPSNACSDRSDEPQVSDVEYDSDTSSADPSSEAYDLSQVINGYILHSSSDRDDVEVVITHDEDWFALLTDEDVELPDGQELLRRLKDVFRVTVKDGCAFPARVESFHETLCQFESDYIHSAATEPMLEFGLCSLSSPFAEIGQLVEQELMKFRQINDESTTLIVVMGAAGSGKTTFINAASGGSLTTGDGLRSCTSTIQLSPVFLLDDRQVVLIDTPGFDDTNVSEADVLRLITTFLASTYKKGKKLAGVIYLHRISDVRMGGISFRNFKMFRQLCGEETLKNVVIATTMWSNVSQNVGEARELELKTNDSFFKPFLDKEGRVVRHDDTPLSARAILRLLIQNEPLPLHIQTELVDEGVDSMTETAAGGVLDRELKKQREKYQREISEMMEAMEARDKENRRVLEEAKQEVVERMKQVKDDVQKLAFDLH